MIANFDAVKSVVANRVTMGDKHDTSIEFLMKKNPDSHFLIVPRGERYEVMVGSITGAQSAPEEVDNAVREVPRAGEEESRRGREKAGSKGDRRKRTK